MAITSSFLKRLRVGCPPLKERDLQLSTNVAKRFQLRWKQTTLRLLVSAKVCIRLLKQIIFLRQNKWGYLCTNKTRPVSPCYFIVWIHRVLITPPCLFVRNESTPKNIFSTETWKNYMALWWNNNSRGDEIERIAKYLIERRIRRS